MKLVMPQLKGLADGNLVRQVVGEELGKRVTCVCWGGTPRVILRRCLTLFCLLAGCGGGV